MTRRRKSSEAPPVDSAALRQRVTELEEEVGRLRAAPGSDCGPGDPAPGPGLADRYRTMSDAAADMIFVVDEAGCVEYVNPAGARAFRLEPHQVVGRSLDALFPPDKAEEHWGRIRGVLATGEPFHATTSVPFGERRLWLDTSLVPLTTPEGERRAVMGVSRDVTERVALREKLEVAVAALEEEETFSRTVFQSAPALFYVLDFQGRFQRWNARLEEVTGLGREELRRINALDLFEGEDRARVAEGIARTAEAGEAEVEARLLVRDGPPVLHLFTGRSVNMQGARFLVGMGMDIDARERQEQALRERVKELRCLFQVSRAAESAESEDALFRAVTEILPGGFQHPETAVARVVMGRAELDGASARGSLPALRSPILVGGAEVGVVEVTCMRGPAPEGTARFLEEEEELVDAVARMVGDSLSRRRAREQYVDLYENAPDMFVSVDPDTGHVVKCNHTLLEATGFRRDEVEGHHVLERYHPDSVPRALEAFQQFQATGEVSRGDLQIRRKDGSPLDVSLKVRAVRDAEGKIVHSRSSWRDVTAERALRTELEASERRLHALLDRLPVPVCRVDEEGALTFMNRRFHETFGYTHEDVPDIEHWWRAAYPDPVYRADVIRRWEEALEVADAQGTDIPAGEYEVTCKDGRVRTMEIGGARVDGAVLATFRDHTALRRAQGQERAAAERYRALFATVPVSVWDQDWRGVVERVRGLGLTDPHDLRAFFAEHPDFVEECLGEVKILAVNKETLLMFGASTEEQMLASLATVFNTPDTLPGFVDELVALGSGEPRLRTEMLLNTVGGQTISVILTMTFPPPDDASGRVIVSLLDITRRKAAEEALQMHLANLEVLVAERTAALEDSNRELESFAYAVSHDLRAPLRAISGFSQALAEDYGEALDDEGRDYLDRLDQGARKMAQLIDDILSLSRVSRSGLDFSPVSLTELAREVAPLVGWTEGLEVQEGLCAWGDRHMVRLLLQNLLENARKFTSRRERPGAEVGVREVEGRPVFFVRDNGAGFDMSYANKLFVPFHRLHQDSEFEGSGIGLSIVQRIVHRHGGQVWGEGAVDQGATIFFTLPGRPGAPPAMR